VVGEIAINIWHSRRTDAVQNGLLLRNTSKYIQRKFFYSLLPTRCYASAGNSDRNVSVRLSRADIVSKRRNRHDFFTIW